MCSRASKNLAELLKHKQRQGDISETYIPLAFSSILFTIASCKFFKCRGPKAILPSMYTLISSSFARMCRRFAPSKSRPIDGKLREVTIKLTCRGNDRSTSSNSVRVSPSSRHSSQASTTMKTFDRVRISDVKTSLSWSSVGQDV